MQRISQIDAANAPAKTQDLLAAVTKQMGGVPNLLKTMAQSSAALSGYLGFAGAISGGTLTPALREQIALTVAGANACDYCASAHTMLAKGAGVDKAEAAENLHGRSSDPKTTTALTFVRELVRTRGHVSDASLKDLTAAGFDQEAVVEIVANVALNIFTNYFNHVAATEVDFPLVSTRAAAVAAA